MSNETSKSVSEAITTGYFYGSSGGGGGGSFTWAMATTGVAASGDAIGDLCFLPLFRDMAFFYLNFGAATMGSSVTAAAVSADVAGASAVEVDGLGSWLPSHSVRPWRLAVAEAAQGLGAWLSASSVPSLWGCWLSSMSFCSRARMRAMVSYPLSVICWADLAAISKTSCISGSRCLSTVSCSPLYWTPSLVGHSWLSLLVKNLRT